MSEYRAYGFPEHWSKQRRIDWLRMRLRIAEIAYRSHGATDDCSCYMCEGLRRQIDELMNA